MLSRQKSIRNMTNHMQSFAEFLREKKFCDFCIRMEEGTTTEELGCHRVVLASSSPYFRNILESNEKCSEVLLNGANIDAVKIVIDYIYSHEVTISLDNAFKLIEIAHIFQIDDLIEEVLQFIIDELTPDNCLKARDLFLHFDKRHHVQLVDDFINKNFVNIATTESFKKSGFEFVLFVISRDQLLVEHEQVIVDAVFTWVTYDTTVRRRYLRNLLYNLRLCFLTFPQLNDLISKLLVQEDQELVETLQFVQQMKMNESDGESSAYTYFSLPRANINKKVDTLMMCIGGCGKNNQTLKSVEMSYDSARTWKEDHNLQVARRLFGAIIHEGFVYIVGGRDSDGKKLGSCMRYDISKGQWSDVLSLPEPRAEMAVVFHKNKMYVTGGYYEGIGMKSVLSLKLRGDRIFGNWKKEPPMKSKRYGHITLATNNTLYSIGGHGTLACEKLELGESKWSKIAQLKHQHGLGAGCIDQNGHLFIAGGTNIGKASAIVETYNPTTNQWSDLSDSSLAIPSCGLSMAVCNGKIICVGGKGNNKEIMDSVYEYEPDTQTWSEIGKLNVARTGHAVITMVINSA